MKQPFIRLVFIFGFILFYSCQDVLECVINRHPVLEDKTLRVGQVDHIYHDHFSAQIKNEPLDNSYDYFFHISDNLPPGLDIIVDFRTIIIEGIPEQSGTFFIEVHLDVQQYDYYYDDCASNFNDCDGLCRESTSRTYSLRIR